VGCEVVRVVSVVVGWWVVARFARRKANGARSARVCGHTVHFIQLYASYLLAPRDRPAACVNRTAPVVFVWVSFRSGPPVN
jgi:hypothetical protein